MRPLKNMENKIPSDKFGRVQLICVEVQAHISSEPPQYYNQDQTPLMPLTQTEDQTPLTLIGKETVENWVEHNTYCC